MHIIICYIDIIIYVCSINIALKIVLSMKKEENLNKMAFRDYYDTLSDDVKETVRNRILGESGMSYTTFYYKLRNNTFKPLERKLIDNIINDVNPKVLC